MIYDLAIVGAGPAGCACAIQALMEGLHVVLVERKHFPRYRPGETLHPGIEPLLQKLGINIYSENINPRRFLGIWQQSISGKSFFNAFSDRRQNWQGFQIRRAELDQLLLQRVIDLGGKVIIGSAAELKNLNSPWEISIAKEDFLAHYLVDASGSHGFLTRLLGLQKRYHSPKFYLRFGYSEVPALLYEGVMFKNCIDGWLYQAQIDAHTRHWCRLSTKILKKDYLPKSLAGYKSLGAKKGYDASWQSIAPFAGTGYFLVGDAAYRLDPSSSHGVLKAIMSGIYAAHLTAKEKQGAIKRESIIQIYQAYIGDCLKYDIAELKKSEWYRSISC